MAQRIVVAGDGPGGVRAAGELRHVDRTAECLVFTQYADVGYSPYGIHLAHGGDIASFERILPWDEASYWQEGADIRYETGDDRRRHLVDLEHGQPLSYDRLVLATGLDDVELGVPGSDLKGLHSVENICATTEWGKRTTDASVAVIANASPSGVELAIQLAHRAFETHLVDPRLRLTADMADPDILQPVEKSFGGHDVRLHLRTQLESFAFGEQPRAVVTPEAELPAALVVIAVATCEQPKNRLALRTGTEPGGTGGLVVDEQMRTPGEHICAVRGCAETLHGLTMIPTLGSCGKPRLRLGKWRAQRRWWRPCVRTGQRPTGDGRREVGHCRYVLRRNAGKGVGHPFLVGTAHGISRARYYTARQTMVKLFAGPRTHRPIGARWSPPNPSRREQRC